MLFGWISYLPMDKVGHSFPPADFFSFPKIIEHIHFLLSWIFFAFAVDVSLTRGIPLGTFIFLFGKALGLGIIILSYLPTNLTLSRQVFEYRTPDISANQMKDRFDMKPPIMMMMMKIVKEIRLPDEGVCSAECLVAAFEIENHSNLRSELVGNP